MQIKSKFTILRHYHFGKIQIWIQFTGKDKERTVFYLFWFPVFVTSPFNAQSWYQSPLSAEEC